MTITRNFYAYNLEIPNVAGFTAGSALVGGSFVYVNGGDWTIKTAAQSGTTPIIGVVTGDVANGTTEVEVVTSGYVRMQTQIALAAGDKVYPSSVKGRIIKTGAAATLYPAGLGVVVAGASASGFAIVKLYGLV